MDKIYTTPQAAEYLDRSYSGLKLHIYKGHLTGTKQHNNLRWFTKQELDDFAEQFPVGSKVAPSVEEIIEDIQTLGIKKSALKYRLSQRTLYRIMDEKE